MRPCNIYFGVICAALVLVSCSKGSYSLTNMASEPIARATVTVCEQTSELKDIAPGHSAPGCYTAKGDDQFVIDVEFESGKKLRNETGYVTSGMDLQHEIVITDSEILLILLKPRLDRDEEATDSLP